VVRPDQCRALPLRIVITAIVGLFFLPIYLVPGQGMTAVGTAHAYQYALIMGYLGASRGGSSMRVRLLPLGGLSVIYIVAWAGMVCIWRTAPADIAIATSVGWAAITIWHFLIDADS
jgi:hypothetical protein